MRFSLLQIRDWMSFFNDVMDDPDSHRASCSTNGIFDETVFASFFVNAMSSRETSNNELVVWHHIRNEYENKYSQHRHVPLALKYLISQFSKRIIGSTLLTTKEDLEFFQLLTTKLPATIKFKCLFRASDHGFSASEFHKLCDEKGPTITIIKSNWGNIFGGYTSISWTNHPHFCEDKNAFLFLIKCDAESVQTECPQIFKIKQSATRSAVFHNPGQGPCFGMGFDIAIKDKCDDNAGWKSYKIYDYNYTLARSYDIDNVILCGGKEKLLRTMDLYVFKVMDYHVFQVLE